MALHSDYEDSENDNPFVDLSNDDDADCSYEYDSSDSEDDDSMTHENRKMWNVIASINKETKEEAHYARTDKKPKKFRRSTYKDVSIKVDSDIYELDRIKLALKSDYFEKQFTGDFDQKENEHLEIRTIDSDTFYSIVDMIYGRELKSVLNINNFATLLLAMDYLQMEIDLKVFHEFITKNFQVRLTRFPNMVKLLDSIDGNPNFLYLLTAVYQYFSIHLIDVLECEEFLSLRYEQLVKIINRNKFPKYTKEKRKIGSICTEWICVDITNRLPRMTELVNAAKFRYNFDFRVDDRSMDAKFLLEIDDRVKQKKEMERYFNNLLNQNGQIDPDKRDNNPNNLPMYSMINRIDLNYKWATFLENDLLYDITVKVEEKIYKLHRYKLSSKSDYFLEQSAGNSSEFLKPLNKDEIHLLDEIEQMTFETIIEYIYFDSIDLDSNVSIANLLKSSEFLKIHDLKKKCLAYIIDNLNSPRIYDEFIEIMNFSTGKEGYRDLCSAIRDHIVSTWPKIGTMPDFGSISRTILMSILKLEKLEINHADEILDICAKWIAYDAPARYQFLPRIANAIARNSLINHANRELETPTDWDECSEQFVRDKLWQILSSIRSVIFGNDTNSTPECGQKPMFIATPTEEKTLWAILDSEFNKIVDVHSLKISCNEDVSAALIGNNLYILFDISRRYHFQVYNLSTKKLFSLGVFHRLMSASYLSVEPTLLNCNDELYCCYENGTVLKYSIEINRWLVISKRIQGRGTIDYASNGKTLFRLSKIVQAKQYIAESYDFVLNSWIQLPNFTSRLQKWCFSKTNSVNLTTVDDDLAIILESDIVVFDQQSQTWRDFEFSIPNLPSISSELGSSIYVQHEDNILCMRNRKLYGISTSNGESSASQKTLPDGYCSINAIHSI